MASYSVELTATAERQLRKLAKPEQARLVTAIRRLAEEPRPRGARKLQGFDDLFRIRVGTYRVIYSVEEERLLVLVLKLGHRKDVYR
jgi:mRNA interferase RelE/StbE